MANKEELLARLQEEKPAMEVRDLSFWTNYVVLTELFSFVIFLYSPLIALKYASFKLILY